MNRGLYMIFLVCAFAIGACDLPELDFDIEWEECVDCVEEDGGPMNEERYQAAEAVLPDPSFQENDMRTTQDTVRHDGSPARRPCKIPIHLSISQQQK